MSSQLPIIDVGPLIAGTSDKYRVVNSIGSAARELGFFYITGHGIDEALQQKLEALSKQFFDQTMAKKLEVSRTFGQILGYYSLDEQCSKGNVRKVSDLRLNMNMMNNTSNRRLLLDIFRTISQN